MRLTNLIFGVQADSLEESREKISSALGEVFLPHESDFRSGLYFRAAGGGCRHFILQKNWDDIDEEVIESVCKDLPFLLYANELHDPENVKGALKSVAVLVQEISFDRDAEKGT